MGILDGGEPYPVKVRWHQRCASLIYPIVRSRISGPTRLYNGKLRYRVSTMCLLSIHNCDPGYFRIPACAMPTSVGVNSLACDGLYVMLPPWECVRDQLREYEMSPEIWAEESLFNSPQHPWRFLSGCRSRNRLTNFSIRWILQFCDIIVRVKLFW